MEALAAAQRLSGSAPERALRMLSRCISLCPALSSKVAALQAEIEAAALGGTQEQTPPPQAPPPPQAGPCLRRPRPAPPTHPPPRGPCRSSCRRRRRCYRLHQPPPPHLRCRWGQNSSYMTVHTPRGRPIRIPRLKVIKTGLLAHVNTSLDIPLHRTITSLWALALYPCGASPASPRSSSAARIVSSTSASQPCDPAGRAILRSKSCES